MARRTSLHQHIVTVLSTVVNFYWIVLSVRMDNNMFCIHILRLHVYTD